MTIAGIAHPPAVTLPPPAPPSAASLCLPPTYVQQRANLTHDANRDDGSYWSPWRISESGRWQHHVYAWAARLIDARGLASVLDVGCGAGTKLLRHVEPRCADVEGIDQASALAVARAQGSRARLVEVDLERPAYDPGRAFDLVLCADVVEHLVDPDPAMATIRRVAHPGTLILISTPERDRERGRDCTASSKPEHVREWSRPEFRRFLQSRGLRPLRSRLFTKDESPLADGRAGEVAFRRRLAERSKWCCQAWVCRVAS